MIKPSDPRQLAIDILARSICSVQVGAAIGDAARRIVSWGWNGVGLGFGEHAEAHAIRRANKRRLQGASIYVASQRRRNAKVVLSMPCGDCLSKIRAVGIDYVWYRDADGVWRLV